MSKRSIGVFVAALVLLTSCSGGDLPEIDAEIGSPAELAFTGGGATESGDVAVDDPTETDRNVSSFGDDPGLTPPGRAGDVYGDNPGFDALWDACDAGIHDACDDLWGMSPLGSGYEAFASTCGNSMVATDGGCSEGLGGSAGDDFFAQHYGDDPGLDAVHDACSAGGGAACDLLYDMSPIDSDYERFALACGDRRALAFTACA